MHNNQFAFFSKHPAPFIHKPGLSVQILGSNIFRIHPKNHLLYFQKMGTDKMGQLF